MAWAACIAPWVKAAVASLTRMTRYPEFHAEATGRFDAGVGDQAGQDEAADAVLLEL
jgi:hypothetical protein